MRKHADVAIIGGGVIGCSIAWQLAQRGKTVLVAERFDHAAGASGSCDQAIIMQSKNPGIHLKLALASVEQYAALPEDFLEEAEYSRHGGMILIETPQELEVMQDFVKRQQQTGLEVEILSADKAHKRQQGLAKHLVGATFSPQDAKINPYKLNLAMAKKARQAGAEIALHTEVQGFVRTGERVHGICTSQGTVEADTVILAAGAWSPLVAEELGLNLPIKPRRGQLVITEPVAPLLSGDILSANYIVAKYNPQLLAQSNDLATRLGVGLSLSQTLKGNLLIGATREFAGYDTRNTREGVRALLGNAARLFPGLRGLNIIRIMAGLRPYTPDGLPLVGPAPGVPGLFLACGHEGDGIALAPVTGRLVTEMLCDGQTFMDCQALKPERFALAPSCN